MIEIKRAFRPARGFERIDELPGYLFTPEMDAHTFIITMLEKAADGTESAVAFAEGTEISARLIKADGVTELVDGSLADGAAVVTLPAECYQVPGRFTLTVYASLGGTVTCIYAATSTVLAGDTEDLNIAGGTVRNIDAKIGEIRDAISDAQDAVEDIGEAVAGVPDVIASIPQDYTALSDSVSDLKSAVDKLKITSWNMYDGSWGLSNTNPVTGSTTSYLVCTPAIDVIAGQKYSVGIISNPLMEKVLALSLRWYTSDGTSIGNAFTLYRQGGKVILVEAPATAAKAVVIFNTNNGSVALTPSEIYNAGFKVVFANRLINFNTRNNYGDYDVDAGDWIPSGVIDIAKTNMPKTEIITVGPSGCMYKSLRAALNDIDLYGDGSEETQFEVRISAGTYDVRGYYTAEERSAADFKGLAVPNYVTLIGVAGKENTIISWDGSSDEANDNISTLNIRNRATLKGLTVTGNNIRYTIHDDFSNSSTIKNIRYVEDCEFIGVNLHRQMVYGSGSGPYGGADWTFKDCTFRGVNHIPFMQHNVPDTTVPSYLKFINCRFIGAKNFELQLASYNSGVTALNYVSVYGCKFATEGGTLGKIYLNEAAGEGIKYKVTGYGNALDSVNIVNTDGVDYSSFVDLI